MRGGLTKCSAMQVATLLFRDAGAARKPPKAQARREIAHLMFSIAGCRCTLCATCMHIFVHMRACTFACSVRALHILMHFDGCTCLSCCDALDADADFGASYPFLQQAAPTWRTCILQRYMVETKTNQRILCIAFQKVQGRCCFASCGRPFCGVCRAVGVTKVAMKAKSFS